MLLAVDTALGACSVALLDGDDKSARISSKPWTAAMPNGWRRWSMRR